MTMPDDMLAYNRQLIDQFRADGGAAVKDRPLLLLTTQGRKTGKQRTSPMMYVKREDHLVVIASNNGASEDPQWYRNLLTDPQVRVELPGQTFEARATPLTGEDYDREWAEITKAYPFFTEHQQRAVNRKIPVVSLAQTT